MNKFYLSEFEGTPMKQQMPRGVRLISAVAVAMMLSCVPVAALADDATDVVQSDQETVAEAVAATGSAVESASAQDSETVVSDATATDETREFQSEQAVIEEDADVAASSIDGAAADTVAEDATTAESTTDEETSETVTDDSTITEAAATDETEADASTDDETTVTVAATAATVTDSAATAASQTTSGQNLYRLYNPYDGEHLFTTSLDEAISLMPYGWSYEGVAWVSPTSGDAVYRLYNPYNGEHLFTLDSNERDHLDSIGWIYEGVGWYSSSDIEGAREVYRLFNPYETVGTHHYTTDSSECSNLTKLGWKDEGTAFWATSLPAISVTPRWVSLSGGRRGWLQSNGSLARNRVVTPSEGAGCYAEVDSDGAARTGSWSAGNGWVRLADSNGAMPTTTGWVVTSAYGTDGLQRYWLEDTGQGFSAARVGLSSAGYTHYTESTGYVRRNSLSVIDGLVYYADNDGHLWDRERNLTDAQKRAVSAAYSTKSYGAGYCSEWVDTVFAYTGYAMKPGTYDANDMCRAWCNSSNLADLVPGMIVAVEVSPTRLGRIYGHVGIYVGNCKVLDDQGYIREMDLSDWLAFYSQADTPRWGWYQGRSLC